VRESLLVAGRRGARSLRRWSDGVRRDELSRRPPGRRGSDAGGRFVAVSSTTAAQMAGKYADDMFEDIGHSNEARKQLKQFLVGPLDATPEEIAELGKTSSAVGGAGSGSLLVGGLIGLVAVAVGVFFYTQS